MESMFETNNQPFCPLHLEYEDGVYNTRVCDAKTETKTPSRSPKQVSDRLDELIAEIKSVIEGNSASWPGGQIDSHRSQHAQDIVCVAHGHILAAMAIRWVGLPLDTGMMRLIFEPGGVAVLGYVLLPHCFCRGIFGCEGLE